MTFFTDVYAALEEAEYLALMTDQPHAIVCADQGMHVMTVGRALFHRRQILEVCQPVEDAA